MGEQQAGWCTSFGGILGVFAGIISRKSTTHEEKPIVISPNHPILIISILEEKFAIKNLFAEQLF